MAAQNDQRAQRRWRSGDRVPLSDDPEKRERQLANLVPGAGQWPPGATTNLKNGLRTRNPPRLVLSEVCDEIVAALSEGLPVRGADGGVPAADHYAVELAAVQLLAVRRCNNYLALHGEVDERGHLRPEFEGWQRAVMRASALLDKLGMSPTSRARLGVDIAKTVDLSMAMSEKDPVLRAKLLAAAGVVDGEVVDG